jgi:hypothetical protein
MKNPFLLVMFLFLLTGCGSEPLPPDPPPEVPEPWVPDVTENRYFSDMTCHIPEVLDLADWHNPESIDCRTILDYEDNHETILIGLTLKNRQALNYLEAAGLEVTTLVHSRHEEPRRASPRHSSFLRDNLEAARAADLAMWQQDLADNAAEYTEGERKSLEEDIDRLQQDNFYKEYRVYLQMAWNSKVRRGEAKRIFSYVSLENKLFFGISCYSIYKPRLYETDYTRLDCLDLPKTLREKEYFRVRMTVKNQAGLDYLESLSLDIYRVGYARGALYRSATVEDLESISQFLDGMRLDLIKTSKRHAESHINLQKSLSADNAEEGAFLGQVGGRALQMYREAEDLEQDDFCRYFRISIRLSDDHTIRQQELQDILFPVVD